MALPEVLCDLGRLSDTIKVKRCMCFAPTPEETDGEAAHPGPGANRPRTRGPRSSQATESRRLKHRIQWAQATAKSRVEKEREEKGHESNDCFSCEPELAAAMAREGRLCVWHCNIQNFLSHTAELGARIRLASVKPDVICLNETNLQHSHAHVDVEGYVVAERRDRNDGRKGGGVLVFVREGIAEAVTCVKICESSERMWLVVHSCFGPLLLGCWYRPPDAGVDSIISLGDDLEELAGDCMAVCVVGDMNVHHEKWLRFSSSTSAEGRTLRRVAAEHGLEQHVRSPTREGHLLDLCLCDLSEVKCNVLAKIADHSVVETMLALPIQETAQSLRKVWLMGAGDWLRLSDTLADHD